MKDATDQLSVRLCTSFLLARYARLQLCEHLYQPGPHVEIWDAQESWQLGCSQLITYGKNYILTSTLTHRSLHVGKQVLRCNYTFLESYFTRVFGNVECRVYYRNVAYTVLWIAVCVFTVVTVETGHCLDLTFNLQGSSSVWKREAWSLFCEEQRNVQ
jgi:hypothetical protein